MVAMHADNGGEFGAAGAVRAGAPHMRHATATRVVKGEDVMFVNQLKIQSEPQSMLYMVCDGHSGADAASFVTSNFLRHLEPKLPEKMPDISQMKELEAFAEQLRKALCETFVRLDSEWSKSGNFAGTTVTAVITTGWLLTVANVGDSSAIVDTGTSILELTKSHRIHDNKDEQARLRAAGCRLASLGFHLQGPAKADEPGVGPMRIWPGGLCVSRSVGDLDAGKEVVPVPHIRQLLIPPEGCRVISASDGLWDVLSLGKAAKLSRPKSSEDAAASLMHAVMKDLRVLDDTSIIIIDCLPSHTPSFPLAALKAAAGGGTAAPPPPPKPSGIFSCFLRPSVDDDAVELPKNSNYYVDIDCLKAYPGLKKLLDKNSMSRLATAMGSGNHVTPNFTLHGGKLFSPANTHSQKGSKSEPASLYGASSTFGAGTSQGRSADLGAASGVGDGGEGRDGCGGQLEAHQGDPSSSSSVGGLGSHATLSSVLRHEVRDPKLVQDPEIVPEHRQQVASNETLFERAMTRNEESLFHFTSSALTKSSSMHGTVAAEATPSHRHATHHGAMHFKPTGKVPTLEEGPTDKEAAGKELPE